MPPHGHLCHHLSTPLSTPRALLAVASALAALLAAVAPASPAAASRSAITVSTDSAASFWSGTVRSDGDRTPDVPACATVACDHVLLKVSLPASTWANHTGGVQVAIRFLQAPYFDELGLYVYRNDTLVASSTATVGTAQAVLIPAVNGSVNGNYQIYAAALAAYGNDAPAPRVDYEGLARVQYDPPAAPPRPLLPNFVALPQQNVGFGPPTEIFDDPVPAGSSCFQSELDEGARLCLRFDQVVANRGEGALDLRYDVPAGVAPQDGDTVPVRQRIYASTGGYTELPAGNVVWHAVHQHWHLQYYTQSKLWAVDAAGNPVGSAPIATGNKNGFCVASTDIDPSYWGRAGLGPASYPAPDCLTPFASSGGFDHFKMGLPTGWTDKYDWFLPDQYIDVADVPDGRYLLATTADPTGRLVEADPTDNCTAVYVLLSGMATAEPQARMLDGAPACPR